MSDEDVPTEALLRILDKSSKEVKHQIVEHRKELWRLDPPSKEEREVGLEQITPWYEQDDSQLLLALLAELAQRTAEGRLQELAEHIDGWDDEQNV